MRLKYKKLKRYNGLITRDGTRYYIPAEISGSVTKLVCFDDPNKKEYLMNTDLILYGLVKRYYKLIYIQEVPNDDHD